MIGEPEGGQFTIRGMLAFVAGCAVVAAVLRFASISISSLAIGFVIGIVGTMMFLVSSIAFDFVERRAQIRWAEWRAKTASEATRRDSLS